MKERPILFRGAMVRALLDGSKTQTRRHLKQQPHSVAEVASGNHLFDFRADLADYSRVVPMVDLVMRSPYGKPGDRLWVRESFCKIIGQSGRWIETDYQATYTSGFRLGDSLGLKKRWTPSIHMPRDASRITLEITGVRVERLLDIREDDCIAEGTPGAHGSIPGYHYNATPDEHYRWLWESINGPDSWSANPWVWVLEFRRVQEGGAA